MVMIMMSSIIKHYSNQLKSWHKLKCWNKLSINVRKYSNSFTFVAPRISFAKYKSTINRILQAQPQGIENLFSPHVEQKRTLGQMKSYKHSSPKVSFWCLALPTNFIFPSSFLWGGLISIKFSAQSEKQSLSLISISDIYWYGKYLLSIQLSLLKLYFLWLGLMQSIHDST